MTVKCCAKTSIWEAVQFNYVDGIDGLETIELAKSLGLSRNGDGGISKIWEIDTVSGWRIVDDGDWILSAPRGFHMETIYTVMKKNEFEKTMCFL